MRRYLGFLLVAVLAAMGPGSACGDPYQSFVEAARSQVGRTLFYDSSYRHLDYPNGDVPLDRGVCTDVVIRAMRAAIHLDLQQLVHEDMIRNFSRYPRRWGLSRPDKNIDHRRVPNLQTYFKRQGWALDLSQDPKHYLPGDMVTCTVPPHLPHIMIVSDKKSARGHPLVIHNIGAGVREEDILFKFELTGHYRIDPAAISQSEHPFASSSSSVAAAKSTYGF